MSQRRACQVLRTDRWTVRYTSIRPDDARFREALKAVAAERWRFGYRRIHVMLHRQCLVMNQKKLRRLYREEKLQVRRREGRKQALGTRRPMPMLVPDCAIARWSLDFVSDIFTDGRRLRCGRRLHVGVPGSDRRHLAVEIAGSSGAGGHHLQAWPIRHDRLGQRHRALTPMAVLRWCQQDRHQMALYRSRQAFQNDFVESFKGRFGLECLNDTLF